MSLFFPPHGSSECRPSVNGYNAIIPGPGFGTATFPNLEHPLTRNLVYFLRGDGTDGAENKTPRPGWRPRLASSYGYLDFAALNGGMEGGNGQPGRVGPMYVIGPQFHPVTNEITIAARLWFAIGSNGASTREYVIASPDNPSTRGYHFSIAADPAIGVGRASLLFLQNGGSYDPAEGYHGPTTLGTNVFGASPFPEFTWCDVAAIRRRDQRAFVYLNGYDNGTYEHGTPVWTTPATVPPAPLPYWYIGFRNYPDYYGSFFGGMAYVAIFDRGLSDDEVREFQRAPYAVLAA